VTNVAQGKAKDPNGNDVLSNQDDETVTREDLPGTIGDKVWLDENANGLQDENELGAAGVKVDLYKEDDTFVATTTTDDKGNYSFSGLAEGSYYVIFTAPQDFNFTKYNVFNNETDTVDSDAQMAWVEVSVSDGNIDQAELGAPLTYTIYYTNTDPTRDATDVIITMQVPVGTTFLNGSQGLTCEGGNTGEGTICTLTIANLAANTSGSATFTVTLGEDELLVPDTLNFLVDLVHGGAARTQNVTLTLGEIVNSLDAGIVRIDANQTTATPPAATNLPPGEQPQQQWEMFLPTLRVSDAPAETSSVAPQTEQTEAQANATFLPTVETEE
jgi:uncharacterized repeat protein (TIGR01451 family)